MSTPRQGGALGDELANLGIIALIAGPLLGIDLTGLLGGGATGGGSEPAGGSAIENCDTGADANADVDCRMAGAQVALDAFWSDNVEGYRAPEMIVVDGATSTQCGTASNAVGPFYCPPEENVYVDPTFFQLMQQQFGASAGDLAQLYIVGHEWGHHIQNIVGIMNGLDLQNTGPTSDGVRLEVQADCFAGAWVGAASTIKDSNGVTFLEPVTQSQVADALSAASAVGDDRIQEATQGQVTPETWTHGSSEMRQRWFTAGWRPSGCPQRPPRPRCCGSGRRTDLPATTVDRCG